jgi:hypothetical protein
LIKHMWSRIRSAWPVTMWPARVTPAVALERPPDDQPLASIPDAPPAASVTEDILTQACAHLEHLGYEIRHEPDGWTFAQHQYRYDFHLRTFSQGLSLHCAVGIGASAGSSRDAWLEFLNTTNNCGLMTRFSLIDNGAGAYLVRMRAVVFGGYSRAGFAMAIDMWHEDLELVRRRPDFDEESSDGDEEDTVAVTVN